MLRRDRAALLRLLLRLPQLRLPLERVALGMMKLPPQRLLAPRGALLLVGEPLDAAHLDLRALRRLLGRDLLEERVHHPHRPARQRHAHDRHQHHRRKLAHHHEDAAQHGVVAVVDVAGADAVGANAQAAVVHDTLQQRGDDRQLPDANVAPAHGSEILAQLREVCVDWALA